MRQLHAFDRGEPLTFVKTDKSAADEILFLFIGGAHQVLHLAPVAAAMARLYPGVQITCLYRGKKSGRMLAAVRDNMRAFSMRIAPVQPPRWAGALARLFHRPHIEKLPMLGRVARHYRHVRAVIAPERTSAWLRKLGMSGTPLIHFRHGAGDRAPASERRLSAFDLIVVPGEKDVDRAVERNGVERELLRQCGYVKIDYLSRYGRRTSSRPFDNDRPIILYNPHFDADISSWRDARKVVQCFAGQHRYNLIVAPHIRIAGTLSAEERAAWEQLSVPGRILVDLDSIRLIDMSHVEAADIYLGDMSSQLYEFLCRPRPAVFLNSHGVDWEADPRYAGWHLGVVAQEPEELLPAIDRAIAEHPLKAAEQQAAVARAFGKWRNASIAGARIVGEFLDIDPSNPAPVDMSQRSTSTRVTKATNATPGHRDDSRA